MAQALSMDLRERALARLAWGESGGGGIECRPVERGEPGLKSSRSKCHPALRFIPAAWRALSAVQATGTVARLPMREIAETRKMSGQRKLIR